MTIAGPSLKNAKTSDTKSFLPFIDSSPTDVSKSLKVSIIDITTYLPRAVPSKDDFMSRIVVFDSPSIIEQMQKDLGTSTPPSELNPSKSTSSVPPSDFEEMVQSIMNSLSFTSIQPLPQYRTQ